jgi:hypothetical protein
MFRNDDFAWLRLELGRELATPRAVFEALARPRCPLKRSRYMDLSPKAQ